MTPSLHDRIASIPDEAFGFERLRSGLTEAHLRVNPDGEQLLLPACSVFQAPVAGSVWVNEQKETAAVEERVWLGLGLGGSDFCVGELVAGHRTISAGLVPPHILSDTPKSTPKSVGWQRTAPDAIGQKVLPL